MTEEAHKSLEERLREAELEERLEEIESLAERLDLLKLHGVDDKEIHKRWLKWHFERRREYDKKDAESERQQFEKSERLEAYWKGYFGGREELMEEMGWKYSPFKKSEPRPQTPYFLTDDDDDDEELEEPEGSWADLLHPKEEEDEMPEDSWGDLIDEACQYK